VKDSPKTVAAVSVPQPEAVAVVSMLQPEVVEAVSMPQPGVVAAVSMPQPEAAAACLSELDKEPNPDDGSDLSAIYTRMMELTLEADSLFVPEESSGSSGSDKKIIRRSNRRAQ